VENLKQKIQKNNGKINKEKGKRKKGKRKVKVKSE